MYFYVIQTVFKPFKNHKNQRSQIMLNFILKILQSAKNQTGLIFFHLKIAQLYIIMYFYVIQTVFKLFKNHKNQRSQIVLNFILKILQSAKNQTRINIFSPQNISVIYNYVFLYYLDCLFFQNEIDHNLRSLIFMIFKWFENSLDNHKNI